MGYQRKAWQDKHDVIKGSEEPREFGNIDSSQLPSGQKDICLNFLQGLNPASRKGPPLEPDPF
jgi:hypothetical protein